MSFNWSLKKVLEGKGNNNYFIQITELSILIYGPDMCKFLLFDD